MRVLYWLTIADCRRLDSSLRIGTHVKLSQLVASLSSFVRAACPRLEQIVRLIHFNVRHKLVLTTLKQTGCNKIVTKLTMARTILSDIMEQSC